jgi:hypothetical protein
VANGVTLLFSPTDIGAQAERAVNIDTSKNIPCLVILDILQISNFIEDAAAR